MTLASLKTSADDEVQKALSPILARIREHYPTRNVTLEELLGTGNTFDAMRQIYRLLQQTEAWSSLGAWIEENRPGFGSWVSANFASAKSWDRSQIVEEMQKRAKIKSTLNALLGNSSLLCMPTTALLTPKKGSMTRQALSFTPLAGLASLPELTLPYGTSREGIPIGISFLASRDNDELLLDAFANSNHLL